ncbi:hypothetical protein AB4Z48_38180, partial [Cupriavidus sp. 2TAF22]|uniref:hypothetical protein n=1 Tax=Cupriavidus sp. 2TAF22 TaxID=3233010 RepID=UPI003F936887
MGEISFECEPRSQNPARAVLNLPGENQQSNTGVFAITRHAGPPIGERDAERQPHAATQARKEKASVGSMYS